MDNVTAGKVVGVAIPGFSSATEAGVALQATEFSEALSAITMEPSSKPRSGDWEHLEGHRSNKDHGMLK